jgi:hypothetical protein
MRTVRSYDGLRRTVKNSGILPQKYVKERQTVCPTIRQNTAKSIGKYSKQRTVKNNVEYSPL